jgi:hypothetical protein
MQLIGGSGGGGGGSVGGGGGGAIELGATGSLTIAQSTIEAFGGSGGFGDLFTSAGGGGSGGGIFLHADSVSLAGFVGLALLDVSGGSSIGLIPGSAGGGGGGGRILILANSYTATGQVFDLANGGGVGFAGAGVLTIGALVPEPSSLVLLATVLPMVAYAWRRRAR